MATLTEWVEHLSSGEIAEIERAVGEFQKEDATSNQVNFSSVNAAARVPLPTLGPRLRILLDEVLNGRGFVLIKGLPVESWTRREAAIAFLIIGVHASDAPAKAARS